MSPSWQARCLNASVRLLVRRKRWGEDERAVARRARRIFGTPTPWGWLRTLGLNVRRVNESNNGSSVRGGGSNLSEWMTTAATR